MCGRLNMIDDLFMRTLLQDLSVSNPNEMLFDRFKMPTNEISIVREVNGIRQLQTATWWLLQDMGYAGFKPVNTPHLIPVMTSLISSAQLGIFPSVKAGALLLPKALEKQKSE